MLECMAEGQVTVDGETRKLAPPFFVIATQNPVETLGTYPLPEAQLDRFLMRISMDMPTKDQERQILDRFKDSEPLEDLAPVCGKEQLVQLQAAARKLYIHPVLMDYIVDLARASREMRGVELGVSPRGTLALLRASQAMALVEGREFVTPEDVKAVGVPVIAHRLAVSGIAGSSQAQREMCIRDSHCGVQCGGLYVRHSHQRKPQPHCRPLRRGHCHSKRHWRHQYGRMGQGLSLIHI